MTAQTGGTGKLYHKEGVSSRVKPISARKRFYFDLAYCRMRLGRLRHDARWAEFYRKDIARLERLLAARRRPPQPVAATDSLTRQINSWVEMVEALERREAA